MRIVFHINTQDVLAFNRFVLFRRPRQAFGLLYFLLLPALIAYGVLADWLKRDRAVALSGAAGVLALTVVFGLFWYRRSLLRRATATKGILGEHVVVISEEGIRETTAGYDLLRPWSRVKEVVENQQYIIVFLDRIHGSQIPKRAFRGETEVRGFVEAARSHLRSAKQGVLPRADEITWDTDLRADRVSVGTRAPDSGPEPGPKTGKP